MTYHRPRLLRSILLRWLFVTAGMVVMLSAQASPDTRLFDGFDNFSRPITTDSQDAQRWFDQGIQLLYGFNHDEAIRSFEQAAELDPDCAMAWWGIAYALGPHINNMMMPEEKSEAAYDAAQEAMARADNAAPVEQALIRALDARYASPPPEDRSHLEEAFAEAMEEVWREFPDDPDVGAFYAESLMNLQPWDLWTLDAEPKGRVDEIVATLERVMEIDEEHPGGSHFYIHAVEASSAPERAVPAAERLPDIVPGAGHLVHMPAHIFARVGRWAEASEANEEAIRVDRAYFEVAPEPEFYNIYYLHNVHFLAWSAMMEGRYETALEAARDVETEMPEPFLREMTFVTDGFMPVVYHVLIRFGEWEKILDEPEPDDYRHVSRALWRYARSIALSNLGRIEEAEAEIERFEQEVRQVPEYWEISFNPAHDVMDVARLMAQGELAFHDGRPEEAFALLREAAELEDALAYAEPPAWMQPVRRALGALLLAQGELDDAQTVYERDLDRHPNNAWALLGLWQALASAGETEEAEAMESDLSAAWARADVEPVASCFCYPGAS